MIDFNNLPEPRIISEIKQDLKIGDKVRCYEKDSTASEFAGYAYITEIFDAAKDNFCWCEAEEGQFETGVLNYFYFVIKI
jgi:hypothetical protein